MRLLPIFLITAIGSLIAGEPAYPLWDGHESVADYAKRVNLPPTKTLDLGNDVKMKLVLIPAGKFIMGTPEPPRVDEEGFRKKISTGQVLLAASSNVLLVLLCAVIIQTILKRQRPKFSLLWLLAMTVMAGGCVLSGLHWQHSARELEKAKADYVAAKERFDSAEQSEKHAHPVTLTQPYYMGKFVVTQEQYQAVIGNNPSSLIAKDNAVDTVTWDHAQAFCKKVAEQTKQMVRLPTEAEWEYACRAGTMTRYYSGDELEDLARVGWYNDNSNDMPHPVGQLKPNAFGLYDMHGSVFQWCEDWYAEDYGGTSEAENPKGPAQGGNLRSRRGGRYDCYSSLCGSAFRHGGDPDLGNYYTGFRIVMVAAFRTP